MLKIGYVSPAKLLNYAALLVALVCALHYAMLHYTLITDTLPLTIRESAPILISEAYAEQLEQGVLLPYSVDQYPQATSLYGPIYTMLSGVTQLFFDVDLYFLHRLMVALTVLASSVLCGLLVYKEAGYAFALLAGLWLYLHSIIDSTIAAGPSALAVLFYVLGFAAMIRFGPGRRGLALAIFAGFLGFLTKPYASLVIPAALTYVYLFHSPRRALIAAGLTAIVTVMLLCFASVFMPTYFHSVFEIHSAYATRHLDMLLSQTWVFSKLNFSLLIAFLFSFPLASYAFQKKGFKCLWGERAIICPDVGFDRFLVLVAAAVLLLVLGWHGGAYLIYYNHLLLPPLLVAVFRFIGGSEKRSLVLRALLVLNIIIWVFMRPPLRKYEAVSLSLVTQFMGKSVLVDPVLEPIARLYERTDVIDNGQTEYLIHHDQETGGAFAERSKAWTEKLASNIESGAYERIYLSPAYYRELLLDKGEPSELLSRNYRMEYIVFLPIYYTTFRDIKRLGSGKADLYYFVRKSESN